MKLTPILVTLECPAVVLCTHRHTGESSNRSQTTPSTAEFSPPPVASGSLFPCRPDGPLAPAHLSVFVRTTTTTTTDIMEAVTIFDSPGKGRGLKATKEMWAGDVVFTEASLAAVVFDR